MKGTWALLLATTSLAAGAHPIYRCDDGQGHVSYQNRACTWTAQPPVETDLLQQQGRKPATSQKAVMHGDFLAFEADPPAPRPSAAAQPLPAARKHQADENLARIQALLRTLNTQREAEYAASRARCENAMRIAAVCGKFSGRFYCDDKGFRPVPMDQMPPMQPVLSARAARSMEQCAQQASR